MPQLQRKPVSSKSVRIDAEIFEAARSEGSLFSRSTAQQIEHWVKIGVALESCGLTVGEIASLLKNAPTGAGDEELWKFKRQRQETDMKALGEGRVTQDQLSWFSGGKARRLKVIGSPY